MSDKKTVLHQVLAAEGDLQEATKKVMSEATKTFGRRELFQGEIKTLTMFDESKKAEEERTETVITTTVHQKLNWVWGFISQYWNCFATKEKSNQLAKADVIIDGEILLENVPATVLLGLESRLFHVRNMYDAIPTLTTGVKWDKTEEEGVYQLALPEEKTKTQKVPKTLVKYAATDKHAAQTEVYYEDAVIGKYKTITRSGAITVAEKARLIGNIDKLIQAIKDARARANMTEISKMEIGDKISSFIHTGTV